MGNIPIEFIFILGVALWAATICLVPFIHQRPRPQEQLEEPDVDVNALFAGDAEERQLNKLLKTMSASELWDLIIDERDGWLARRAAWEWDQRVNNRPSMVMMHGIIIKALSLMHHSDLIEGDPLSEYDSSIRLLTAQELVQRLGTPNYVR